MPMSSTDKKNPQRIFARAIEFYQAGNLKDATTLVDQLCKICPTDSGVWNFAGVLAKARGQRQQAEAIWKKTIALELKDVDSRFNLALLYHETDRVAEAVELYRTVLAIDPNHLQTLNNLGGALEVQGQLEEAMVCVTRVLEINPNHANAHKNRGLLFYKLGLFSEAATQIEKALELDPNNLSFLYSLSTVKRFVSGDPQIQKLEDLQHSSSRFSRSDRVQLHFALSKVYNDIGETEKSFRQLMQGNSEKRSLISYDEARELATLDRMQLAFPQSRFHNNSSGDLSDLPIFIVGMPRSGTTLVEQILASHPQVEGAGELDNFKNILSDVCKAQELEFEPEVLARFPEPILRQIGERYVSSLKIKKPQAIRITDKNPMNFLYLGLIHLVLPKARIIHTRRDPIDTCVSCFEQKFRGPLPFTYDLAELGRYWRAYNDLMGHWRNALPAGVMLEVRYEELVHDQEEQSRRILRHCGVEWNDRCLLFHETQRAVGTASAQQVRRPMYQSSAGRWKLYGAALLKPLLDALNE